MSVFVMAACFNTINAQGIKELEFQRDKWSGKSSESNINKAAVVPVEVKLKADEKQAASGDGIKFTVQWINHSAEAITLYNVIDKLSLVFLTKDYLMPVQRLMTIDNSIGPWKMEEPPFKINGIFLNNVKQDSDITRSRAITIPGKSTYSANLSIAEVVKYDRSLEEGVQNPKAPRYRTPAETEQKIRIRIFHLNRK